MAKQEGAKPKLLRYLKEHVGEVIPSATLRDVAYPVDDWARSLRSLRDEGYIVEYDKSSKTYFFPYSEPQNTPKGSRYISNRLRSLVEIRDNSTCQMCGKDVRHDHIKIHIDHIVPYEWGGPTELENLQCLCSNCNEGKKNYVASENPQLMEQICNATSCGERLRLYFEHYANQEIGVDKLSVIAKTRDWTREVRRLRSAYNMQIEYCPEKKGVRSTATYIYLK